MKTGKVSEFSRKHTISEHNSTTAGPASSTLKADQSQKIFQKTSLAYEEIRSRCGMTGQTTKNLLQGDSDFNNLSREFCTELFGLSGNVRSKVPHQRCLNSKVGDHMKDYKNNDKENCDNGRPSTNVHSRIKQLENQIFSKVLPSTTKIDRTLNQTNSSKQNPLTTQLHAYYSQQRSPEK